MKCPFCANMEDRVVDSRPSQTGNAIRRRRQCLKCKRRFTTYEHIEETELMVVKKDGRREAYDRKKILNGMLKACEKRPISMEILEENVDEIEQTVQKNFEQEVPSKEIGRLVMKKLQDLDAVAYVRFASVYQEFKDVNQFFSELKEVLKTKGGQRK